MEEEVQEVEGEERLPLRNSFQTTGISQSIPGHFFDVWFDFVSGDYLGSDRSCYSSK